MAVARNFYEGDMNILRPRVDRRNDTDGVTGMQFPSYEWLVAGSYKAFGFHEALPRLLNWLIYMAGVVAFYFLVRYITGTVWLAGVGAWGLAWSPEMYYHGINALPDVLALTAYLAGLAWFARWYSTRATGALLLSLLAVTLAGLTKLQFLAAGFPIAVFVGFDLFRNRLTNREIFLLMAYAVIAVGIPLCWYAYALQLIETSGLTDFGIEFRPAPDVMTGLAIIKRNVLSDLPELLLGYGTLGLFVAGLWHLIQRAPTQHPWFWPGVIWSLGISTYYLIELAQMRVHTYYLLPIIPVLLLVAVWGAAQLQAIPKARVWLLVLLVIQPAWAFARINMGRWMRPDPGVAAELYNPTTRAALESATPANALCIAGPDDSGCIAFYFLHKKGFGFEWSGKLSDRLPNGQLYLQDCIARGAQYLYTNDSTVVQNPVLQPYFGKQVKQVGTFRVIQLQAAPIRQQGLLSAP